MEKTNDSPSLSLCRINRGSGEEIQRWQIHADLEPESRLPLHRIGAEQTEDGSAIELRRDFGSSVLKVCWQFWRVTQSDFRYREVGQVDLGEID
jgi:hypothetical protein